MDEGALPATRVNGAFLPNFKGKRVVVIGKIMKTHPNGKLLEVKTSDDRIISVQLNQPLMDSLKGLVEIQGEGTGKNTMTAESYIEFSDEMAEKFDMESYNECVNIINTISNPWRSD